MHFADKLNERIDKAQSRIVIGIDPDPNRLLAHDSKFKKAFPGKSEEYLLDSFCSMVLETAKIYACAVKPQAAFFESMGISGWKSLSRCIRLGRKFGIPVILDAKRGDIGNTAAAYANAYLNPDSEFFADALTVNPYLGPDTLEPFCTMANKHGCGLFILVKTTNPRSGAFQDLPISDKSASLNSVWEAIAGDVYRIGSANIGNTRFSNIGAVVGATFPEHFRRARSLMPNSIFLVPGYGAQGGRGEDVKDAFYPNGKGAIVSSSRGIIFAYEHQEPCKASLSQNEIYDAVLKAAAKAKNDINWVLDLN